MGTSYGKQKAAKAGKLGIGLFTALPHAVIHSRQYRKLGHAARSLLFDIAAQYNRSNNGKLVCCAKYLRPLGWSSNDTIHRALHELKASGLLIETRKGMMPPYSRAAWFAVGWFGLDVYNGLDIEPRHYRKCHLIPLKSLNPIGGVVKGKTIPFSGAARVNLAPIFGSVEPINRLMPAPNDGDFLDIPSEYPIIAEHYQAGGNR
jgi:hypothetical protein